jgi:O-antigen ligase
VAQGFVGPDRLLFIDDPTRELLGCPSGDCTDPWAEGFPRVRPPGLVLVYVAACFAASYLLWGPRRRRGAVGAALCVYLIGLLVSLNRNMLIGLVAGLCLTALLATRRGRFAALATAIVVVMFVTLEVARSSPEFAGNSIAARVLSITAVSELESSGTVSDRVRENNSALETISESPIEGVGWAVSYGVTDLEREDGVFRLRERLFIHNQYLGLWLRTGIVGLAAFVTLLGLSILYGARWLRARSEEDAWLGAAVVTSVGAIALSAVVAIYVLHAAWAPIIAGLMALAVNLRRDLEGELSGARRSGRVRQAS